MEHKRRKRVLMQQQSATQKQTHASALGQARAKSPPLSPPPSTLPQTTTSKNQKQRQKYVPLRVAKRDFCDLGPPSQVRCKVGEVHGPLVEVAVVEMVLGLERRWGHRHLDVDSHVGLGNCPEQERSHHRNCPARCGILISRYNEMQRSGDVML